MPDQSTPTAAPVAPPTWYGAIRGYFNSTDISHMRAQGLDLANYDMVKDHAGDIYQQVATGNMPPGRPWVKAWVDNFLAWMNAGYPKGTPPPAAAQAHLLALAAKPNVRMRKEITALSAPELEKLKTAFSTLVSRDKTDPNSYFVLAGYHWLPAPNTYCMHHVPGYNPWHRAYMLAFENALRTVPGCEDVTLPYWDITTPIPAVLKQAPFANYTLPEDVGQGYNKGYVTTRYDDATIAKNMAQYDVFADIKRALTKTDWEDFHGFFAGAPYNTIIAAHDGGHNSIGDTMADQSVAAFDPIFWFFHANWDRLYWKWQGQMQATDLNGLISTINKDSDPLSYQIFTDPALELLNPFTTNPPKVTTVSTINSVESLNVTYQEPATLMAVSTVPRTKLTALTSEKFSVKTDRVLVTVSGVNRLKIPGSFAVHLLKNGEVIASKAFFQPNEVEKCATCVENALAHFDFELPLSVVSGGKLSVWVEPKNKDFVGDRFPNKLMGNPSIEVRLLLSDE